jgi:hypothetical protein
MDIRLCPFKHFNCIIILYGSYEVHRFKSNDLEERREKNSNFSGIVTAKIKRSLKYLL